MAEIKISELSIGDWVQTVDCEARQKKCCVVEGIEKWRPDYVVVLKYEDGGIETLGIGCIEPIPLTPAILEKNGISKTYESDEYAVYKGEGFNVTEYYTELWEFEKHRNRLMLRNVHQLQHALRLAGVGKEIEV